MVYYYVLLIFTSLLWAGSFVAGKFMVGYTSVLTLTDLRWGLTVLLLIPIVWLKEQKFFPPRQALFSLFVMGLTGVVLFNVFMFLALERTTANNSGLLSALNPVAIALVAFLVSREKITPRQISAIVVSLIGVAVVISHGELGRLLSLRFNTGDLFMLAAVLTWGIYSAAVKRAVRYVTPLMSTLWSGVFGVAVLLPFDLATLRFDNPPTSFWIALIYVGVGATLLAMLFWNIGVQKVGGSLSGIFLNFIPVFTALLAFMFLDERMSLFQWIGAAVIIAGIYLFTSHKLAKKSARLQKNEA